MEFREKFYSKAKKVPSGCWEWQEGKSRRGYGVVHVPGVGTRRAHRYSFEISRGPIPDGLFVLHHCDNPPCINPDHLFLGTHADNATDKTLKGRQPQGESHGRARLTENDVRAIRAKYGKATGKELAAEYGMSLRQIMNIVSRKQWKNVS